MSDHSITTQPATLARWWQVIVLLGLRESCTFPPCRVDLCVSC